jgi:N-acetylmuramoyl-L-alanine amidase
VIVFLSNHNEMNSQRISTILSIVIFSLIVWGVNLAKEVNLLEKKVSEFEETPEIKDNDLKWLALNIYHEARGESVDGMMAVGVVTLNRVNSALYPNTIEQVVKQNHQFSWYWDGKTDNIYDKKSWEVATSVAKIILMKKDLRMAKKLDGALFYHANYVHPYWSRKKEVVATVDNHKFYM